MKRIVLLIALLISTTGVFAQFNQGRWLAGGSVGFSTTTMKTKTDAGTNTDGTSTSFGLGPQAGYFVMDNLAVGASLMLSASKSKSDGTPSVTYSNSTIGLYPFVRYYLDEGIFFQGTIGGGSSKGKTKFNNTTTEDKFGNFLWGLGVGYAYFLNDFVAIEPIVSYQVDTDTDKDDDSKDITSGLYLRVAFQVYLGQRQ
jgi:outer membrane protein